MNRTHPQLEFDPSMAPDPRFIPQDDKFKVKRTWSYLVQA